MRRLLDLQANNGHVVNGAVSSRTIMNCLSAYTSALLPLQSSCPLQDQQLIFGGATIAMLGSSNQSRPTYEAKDRPLRPISFSPS